MADPKPLMDQIDPDDALDRPLTFTEKEVIKQLSQHVSMTVYELMEVIDAPRSTIYKTINDLINIGKVKNATPHRRRNAKYMLGFDSSAPNTIIPSLSYKRKMFKAPFFLQGDDSLATEPLEKFFRGLALILREAEQLSNGGSLDESHVRLRRAKTLLMEASTEFEALKFLCDQVIGDQHFWNVAYLSTFYKDEAWRPNLHRQVLGINPSNE